MSDRAWSGSGWVFFFVCLFFKPGEDEDAGRLMQEAKGFRKSMLVTQLREETICGSIGEAA